MAVLVTDEFAFLVILIISLCCLRGTLLEVRVGKDELCEGFGRDGEHRGVAWGKGLRITDFSSLRSFCSHFPP